MPSEEKKKCVIETQMGHPVDSIVQSKRSTKSRKLDIDDFLTFALDFLMGSHSFRSINILDIWHSHMG